METSNVKSMKYALILALSGLLLGCGHGFEGQYQLKGSSSDKLTKALAGFAGLENIVIGSDYIDADGKREEFDDIFVRESGNVKYLVFERDGSEETWKIVDDRTLVQKSGFINITLERVE